MEVILWLGLAVVLGILVALDLGVFHRNAQLRTVGESLAWSLGWISLGLAFNLFVYFAYQHHLFGIGIEIGMDTDGPQAALQYLTAFLVEKSLSLDNIFVIAMVFTYFKIPLEHQYRVLFWGVLGAFVMRLILIVAGLDLIARFAWLTYVLGALLLASAVKLLVDRHDNLDPGKNVAVKLLRRVFPISDDFNGQRFTIVRNGQRMATPLLVALVTIESADLMFAVDSIPAVFAVTPDPFIAFSSNAFAILGLRSLYFVVAPLIEKFRYIKLSLIFVLALIGVKMMLVHHYPVPTIVSLAGILGILGVGIAASIVGGVRDSNALPSPVEADLEHLMLVSVRAARRVVVAVIGGTVLLGGIVMIVLPGPAFLIVPLGLGILATEFVWAARWLDKAKREAVRLAARFRGEKPVDPE